MFFALWPAKADRAAIAAASAAAVAVCGGRPVPDGNFHVTLAFLGAVSGARLAELAALIGRIADGEAEVPPPLGFTRLEFWRKAGVLALVTDADPPEVVALAGGLRAATLAAGFTPDLKPFRAHVTVARKVRGGHAAALPFAPVSFRCQELALVESTMRAGGPLYSVLESRPLGKAEKLRQSR
ncbi:MAG: RNA 2',3'-cyclic phosphodiesterase [Proteobacteria bacterium]|nr:RNA 2',3'-cyclic phosphodiesterase [Pseudomonadota bacterium]